MERFKKLIEKTPCELLKLNKEDFDSILKKTIKKEWDEIKTSMAKFEYFSGWDEVTIRECCILSKIKLYSTGDVILGDGVGMETCVYFLITGRCRIIQELQLNVTTNKAGERRYSLFKCDEQVYSLNSQDLSKENISASGVIAQNYGKRIYKEKVWQRLMSGSQHNKHMHRFKSMLDVDARTIESRFVQVCVLGETACFGLGEILPTRRIVAMSQTKCLIIPRYWLMNHNLGNIWMRIRRYMDTHIPTTEDVLKSFVAEREWRLYRRKLVESIVSKPPANSISNVPYSIRINEDYEFV